MKPQISPDEASGGTSELWSYPDGEGVMIEIHKGGSAALIWSADLPPSSFMQEVGALVVVPSVARAELLVENGRRRMLPFSRAVREVRTTSKKLQSIAVDAGDDSFTWEARDTNADVAPFPEIPGEVSISFANYNRHFIGRLIAHTATPGVVANAADILAGTERLLETSPPIATK